MGSKCFVIALSSFIVVVGFFYYNLCSDLKSVPALVRHPVNCAATKRTAGFSSKCSGVRYIWYMASDVLLCLPCSWSRRPTLPTARLLNGHAVTPRRVIDSVPSANLYLSCCLFSGTAVGLASSVYIVLFLFVPFVPMLE